MSNPPSAILLEYHGPDTAFTVGCSHCGQILGAALVKDTVLETFLRTTLRHACRTFPVSTTHPPTTEPPDNKLHLVPPGDP